MHDYLIFHHYCFYCKIDLDNCVFPIQPPMNLLTPDSFSSPRKPEDMEHPDENSEDSSLSSKVLMFMKITSPEWN